ncbi:MAG TPA: MgtC/SapB family protein [Candidatus Thermoplasmatota archaeon]|nr:MgtC/SapB family protein [Candidatus Thermoplasmatota archaeon]
MTDFDLLVNILVALGVGGVVGIEREHRGDATRVIAGVRTFPLIAAAGVLAVRVGQELQSPWPVAVGALVAGAFAMGLFAARHSMGVTGLTTPVAMFVTFLAGALIGFNLRLEGMMVGVATAALLVSKKRLHGIAHHITDEEVMSAVQFITIAFILFPLTASLTAALPGTYGLVGPGLVVDPYWILLIVVFVSALSFVSFLAMRSVGPRRGIEVSGLLGGLVNSEATAATLATQAKEDEALEKPAIVGTLLATGTMFARNLAIAAFVSLSFARFMAPALALMAIATLAIALLRERSLRDAPTPSLRLGNPFAIVPALKFALIFLAINVLALGARQMLGPWGVYASLAGAFVSGGAVVASVGTLAARGSLDLFTAGVVGVLACIIGAFNKLIILRATNAGMYKRSAFAYAAVGAVGIVALLVTTLALR